MRDKASDALRTVTTLMLVRHMPESDFNRLCANLLDDPGNTAQDGTILHTTERLGTFPGLTEHLGTLPDAPEPCDVCGEVVDPGPLSDAAERATGMLACKACIDTALGAIFGPDDEGAARDLMAGHVIELAAAIRGGKPQRRDAAGSCHAAA